MKSYLKAGNKPEKPQHNQPERQEIQEEEEEQEEVQEGEELAPDPESVDMSCPLTPVEEEVKACVSFLNRKKKGGHGDCFIWYGSKEEAARAIFQWAQEGWRKRVEVIATQIASKEAPLAASISMKLPLSSPERAIASLVAWQNRVAKGQEKHQHVVFRYKAGGPQTKMNTSRYYPTKEIAARAIHQWAGDDWANRVITKHQSLVHLQIGEEPEAVQEARITSMVRNLRCNYVSWLQKKSGTRTCQGQGG